MITGWPRLSDNFWPTIRAMMSLPPPGVKPTTMRMAREGYFDGSSCADAVLHAVSAVKPTHQLIAIFLMPNSKPRDVNMKHGSLAVVDRSEAAVDGGGQFIRLADAFAMGA